LKRQIRHTARWPPGKRHWALPRCSSCSVARIPATRPGICAPPPARARSSSNASAASHAIPVAVLCCGTLSSGCSNFAYDLGGAKGTRTPDPLLANNRQTVYPRPYPQVTVLPRPSNAARVHTCCGTSVLYTYKPQREGLDVRAPLVPGQRPRVGCSVRCHEYLDPT
jgi:hypothetical protein